MAKSQADVLFERLRANGLRKRVARTLSDALSSAHGSRAVEGRPRRGSPIAAQLVADLEDRAKGGPAKRQAAAKKAAATRKRKARAQRRGEEGRPHAAKAKA